MPFLLQDLDSTQKVKEEPLKYQAMTVGLLSIPLIGYKTCIDSNLWGFSAEYTSPYQNVSSDY